VRDGKVKRPDYPGLQARLNRSLEEGVKPVLGDLSFVIEQGTIRIRDEVRRGGRRNGKG